MAGRSGDTVSLDIQIVGLVRDTKYSSVKREIPAVYFIPHRQMNRVGEMNFYVRTNGEPASMLRAIPGVVQRIDAALPVERLKTMPEEIRRNTAEDRLFTTLTVAFAILATLLAAIGLYGVLAYSVAQRTREIGVRIALGARESTVATMVVREALGVVGVGLVAGVAGAIGLTRVLATLLYDISPTDPLTFGAVTLALGAVAVAASYFPARRAARVDPIVALRQE